MFAVQGALAALYRRTVTGEGQIVDVSMADGALSWLAMVAASYFADVVVPRRGDLPLAGSPRSTGGSLWLLFSRLAACFSSQRSRAED